ncbi:MAG: hypothetical protein P8M50_03055 [Paracoccaceae bacterium]|nr:hypothetical protein [Paracoccaceae bacterium]
MNEKSPYNKIDPKIWFKINTLLDNGYEHAALGTVDKNHLPLVTKVIPLVINNKIYMLLSDLSEHTKNIIVNSVASLYFAARENHRTRSNNVRLSLQGSITKLSLDKNGKEFKLLVEKHSKVDIGSELWAYFDDFNFYEFHRKRQLYVEGFGKAYEEVVK